MDIFWTCSVFYEWYLLSGRTLPTSCKQLRQYTLDSPDGFYWLLGTHHSGTKHDGKYC